MPDKGLRYNEDKIRYDLLEPFAIEELAKVFTAGARKYEDNNWLKGMKWSKMLASLKRHLAAFEKGEDFDFDPNCEKCKAGECVAHTGLLHMAHAAWNCMGLVSYYRHYLKGDDRLNVLLPQPRIGLDIDDVICEWVGPWCAKHKIDIPSSWYFEWDTLQKFKDMNLTGELAEFYLALPPKIKAEELSFEPVVYITHRPVTKEVTMQWLEKHGFPLKPVEVVESRKEKIDVAKKYELDLFVDDNYDTFSMMNANGIGCYLLDAKHNQKYSVGFKRIKSLKDIKV